MGDSGNAGDRCEYEQNVCCLLDEPRRHKKQGGIPTARSGYHGRKVTAKHGDSSQRGSADYSWPTGRPVRALAPKAETWVAANRDRWSAGEKDTLRCFCHDP